MGAQAALFVINLGRTIVLARLLTPQDFGLIGMVTVIIAFATMFKNAGLNTATIQRDRIAPDQISTLFWINVAISIFLGICIVIGAPIVAAFYGRPELSPVTAVLAISFVVQGLTIQHSALLRRHMRFGVLAIEQVLAALVSLTVTTIMALLGWRYWALVGGTITSSIAMLLLTYYFCPWRPGSIKRNTGVRQMLKFGGHITGFDFVNYFARNSDNILIGKYIGADGLGFYAKAYQLFMMPLQQIRGPIAQVALPVLSSLQYFPDKYRKYYKSILDILSILVTPISVYCAIEAHFLINFVLGEQWMAAVPVFRILAIGGIIISVAGTRGLILMSCGKSKRYLKWGLANAVITVSSFAIGLRFGIVGVATAYTATTYIILVPSLFYCFQKTPVTVGLFFRALMPSLINAMAAAMVISTIKWLFETESILFNIVCALVFTLVYGGLTISRKTIRSSIALFRRELPRRKKTAE